MSDFLESKKQEIRARLTELQGAVDEYQRLQDALAALDGVAPRGATAAKPRAAAKPAAPKATGAGTGKRGRPRGSGQRAAEVVAAVTKEPGLTAAEIAERIGINQNYLYRVLPQLEQDGKLHKRGRGWYLPG